MRVVRSRKRYCLRTAMRIIAVILCLVAGVLVGIIFTKIKNGRIAQDRRVYICSLRKNVESGQVLKQDDVIKVPVINEGEQFSLPSMEQCIGKRIREPLNKGTVLNSYMLVDGEKAGQDIRKVPYSFVRNADALKRGDYIDVRISFPNGADFVLLGKKEVIRVDDSDSVSEKKLWLGLSEEEILRMSSAVVDAYLLEDAYIYAVIYMNSLQSTSVIDYPVNEVVEELINKDPNIVKIAQDKKTFDLRKSIYENTPKKKEECSDLQEEGLLYFD